MAFAHNLSIFSAVLIIVAIFATKYATADLIDTVCGKTQQPAVCSQALRADPRSKNADLKGLATIAIDISTSQAKSGQSVAKSLEAGATDPKLKGIYSTCVENYSDAVDTLGECPDALKSGDFQGLNVKASAAQNEPDTCDDGFSDASIAEPAQLKDASSKLQAYCSIILVVSNMLIKG